VKCSELLAASGLPGLEARLLLAHALGVDRAWIAAHGDEAVGEDAGRRAGELYRRRAAGEPVAYLMGEREFYGLAFEVTPAVLIPRPETELLVEAALERLADGGTALDLGTGSGAIAIALAHERPAARVAAGDASAQALEVARANAARHGARVRFERSDWFSAFGVERFDVVVSNPPYIASGDPHLAQGDLRFEPRDALEAGPTGLECLERIAAAALEHLAPGGWLLLEHGHDQGEACVSLLKGLGYDGVRDRIDLAGVSRVVQGRV
jgi:release factor glutamine methyltransferase